ncbi:MAG: Bax inhibitor-1 family protein [Verrucomicrobiota bacterium]
MSEAPANERAAFIRNTYLHLAGAIGAFVLLEWLLIGVFGAQVAPLAMSMIGGWQWLLVLGAFMVVGTIADRWASSQTSKGMQYLGLGLFIVAEAIIFLPLLFIAIAVSGGNLDLISQAGLITALLVAGLTVTAFITRQDFSFLRGVIVIGSFVALGLIVASFIFGFDLGLLFSGAMILLMAASILYTTSNIIHHYQPTQHVAASLALFASVATLFWYVLQFVMSLASSD